MSRGRLAPGLANGLLLAVTLLTAFPAPAPPRVDRRATAIALLAAGMVGAALGGVAAAADQLPGLLGPVAAVSVLAILTRGLHLDGLADLADGLGSRRPAATALEIMRRSDIGPFGVVVLLLVILGDVAALTRVLPVTVMVAAAAGRVALAPVCARGVPAARADGLGALVAGSVPRWAAAAAVAALLVAAQLAGGWRLSVASAAGLLAAAALTAQARRRLGGITGDVLGAVVETVTLTTLVVAALLRS